MTEITYNYDKWNRLKCFKIIAFSKLKLEIFLTSPLFIERTSKRDVFLYSGVQQPRLLRCIGHRVPVFTEPWQDEKQRKKQTIDNQEMWKNTLSLPSQQALIVLIWNEEGKKTCLMIRLKLQIKEMQGALHCESWCVSFQHFLFQCWPNIGSINGTSFQTGLVTFMFCNYTRRPLEIAQF